MKELILNVVTPERSIVSHQAVESVILPGELGQLNILPGHINFITSLSHGSFGYQVKGEWQIAFLQGGFAQVSNGVITVLAETLDMSNELDVAQAELDITEIQNKMKALKPATPEYAELQSQKVVAQSKLKAAQKKMH